MKHSLTYYVIAFIFILMPSIVFSQNYPLISLSRETGLYDVGAIFTIDGSRTTVEESYSFYFPNYGFLGEKILIQGSNGDLYGTSMQGGRTSYSRGNLFKYNPSSSTYTNLYNMQDVDSADGYHPLANLLEANNGKFYGTTRRGGSYDFGTIYEYDENTGIFRHVFDFNDTLGKYPQSALVQHANGKIYGMSYSGGKSNLGLVYELDISTNTVTKKQDLNDYLLSVDLECAFTLTSTGKLFAFGRKRKLAGSNVIGAAIFEYDVQQDTILFHVNYTDSTNVSSNGIGFIRGAMIEDSTGMLIGASINNTRFFKFDLSSLSMDTIVSLAGLTYGSNITDITIGPNNILYGNTFHNGTLFMYDLAADTASVLYHHASVSQKITAANNGKLYMFNLQGQLLEYNPASRTVTIKLDQNELDLPPREPVGELLRASNGKYYGVSRIGGTFNRGTIFEYDPFLKNITVLLNFDSTTNAAFPQSSLIEGSVGKLYGASQSFASSSTYGYIFEYDIALNNLTTLTPIGINHFFHNRPVIDMVKASNNKFYGMIRKPFNLQECIFEFDPQNTQFSIKKCFTVSSFSQIQPYATASGDIYFTSPDNGQFNSGALYQYDFVVDSIITKYSFPNVQFVTVGRELVEIDSTRLLGYTKNPSINGSGTLFEYNLTQGTVNTVFDFSTVSATDPIYIKRTSNGKVIGYSAYSTFLKDYGEIFEFDLSNNSYTSKYILKKTEIEMGPLTEVIPTITNISDRGIQNSFAKVYPNPVKNNLFIQLNSNPNSEIRIEIFSLEGKLMSSNSERYGSLFHIDFNYPPGAYILKVTQGSHLEEFKLVKVE